MLVENSRAQTPHGWDNKNESFTDKTVRCVQDMQICMEANRATICFLTSTLPETVNQLHIKTVV